MLVPLARSTAFKIHCKVLMICKRLVQVVNRFKEWYQAKSKQNVQGLMSIYSTDRNTWKLLWTHKAENRRNLIIKPILYNKHFFNLFTKTIPFITTACYKKRAHSIFYLPMIEVMKESVKNVTLFESFCFWHQIVICVVKLAIETTEHPSDS